MKKISWQKLAMAVALLVLLQVGLFIVYSRSTAPETSPPTPPKEQKEEKEGNSSISEEKDDSSSLRHPLKKASSSETNLNFLFFGDMMLDRNVGKKIRDRGVEYIFKELAGREDRFFQGSDIIGANLEGAVTDKGAHYPPDQAYDFAFSPETIKILRDDYNFNFFNIANNHLADQGERGIRETRKNLSRLGIDFTGCRDGVAGECSLEFLDIQGEKVAFLGFSMVYNLPSKRKMTDLVEKAASSSDKVIVNVHWGKEYKHRFNSTQQNLARSWADAGADLIIGHHPHVVQGIEVYKGVPIFYSLGNFIFDQYFSEDTQEGLAIGCNWKQEKLNLFLFPHRSRESQPSLLKKKEKERFFKEFIDWSEIDQEVQEEVKQGELTLEY